MNLNLLFKICANKHVNVTARKKTDRDVYYCSFKKMIRDVYNPLSLPEVPPLENSCISWFFPFLTTFHSSRFRMSRLLPLRGWQVWDSTEYLNWFTLYFVGGDESTNQGWADAMARILEKDLPENKVQWPLYYERFVLIKWKYT